MAYGKGYRLDRNLWRPVRPRGVSERVRAGLGHAFLTGLLHALLARGLGLVGEHRLGGEGLSWLPDGDLRGASG